MDRYYFQCLFLCFAEISASLTAHTSVLVHVGSVATLPCNWTGYAELMPSQASRSPHLRWQTPEETILELKGKFCYQADGYKGRAEVSDKHLHDGDCSLRLLEVRYSDAGLYESFIIVGHARDRSRSFLQSVQLKVTDHKSRQTLMSGDDLLLSLHTSQAATVVFLKPESKEESIRWTRGVFRGSQHDVKEDNGVLIFQNIKLSDSGIYKVLDADGLAISTTLVTVEESAPEKTGKLSFETVGADREAHSKSSRVDASIATTMTSLVFFCFLCPVM